MHEMLDLQSEWHSNIKTDSFLPHTYTYFTKILLNISEKEKKTNEMRSYGNTYYGDHNIILLYIFSIRLKSVNLLIIGYKKTCHPKEISNS